MSETGSSQVREGQLSRPRTAIHSSDHAASRRFLYSADWNMQAARQAFSVAVPLRVENRLTETKRDNLIILLFGGKEKDKNLAGVNRTHDMQSH